MSEAPSHHTLTTVTITNVSPLKPRVLYGLPSRPTGSDKATAPTSSAPAILGIVSGDGPASASNKPKRTTRASTSASTSKVSKKKTQRNSASSSSTTTTATAASSSNAAETGNSNTRSSADTSTSSRVTRTRHPETPGLNTEPNICFSSSRHRFSNNNSNKQP